MPMACRAVYNSGVTKFRGRYLMVCRYESLDKKQHLWLAWSDDGFHFRPDKKELKVIIPPHFREEYKEFTEGMIYDPRVTQIGDTYYVFYACHSGHGARIGMAKTKDWSELRFFGFGSPVENRNAVLFPEKINGLFCRLERPQRIDGYGHIWISFSPDMIHWGQHKMIAKAGSQWEWRKIGPGAPPLKTRYGWLEIYHAVYGICTTDVYSLGAILLDLKDPTKVLARTKAPIIIPEASYERIGEAPNIIFTGGAILEKDGEVKIYYGACDTVQCVGTAHVDDLIEACYKR